MLSPSPTSLTSTPYRAIDRLRDPLMYRPVFRTSYVNLQFCLDIPFQLAKNGCSLTFHTLREGLMSTTTHTVLTTTLSSVNHVSNLCKLIVDHLFLQPPSPYSQWRYSFECLGEADEFGMMHKSQWLCGTWAGIALVSSLIWINPWTNLCRVSW